MPAAGRWPGRFAIVHGDGGRGESRGECSRDDSVFCVLRRAQQGSGGALRVCLVWARGGRDDGLSVANQLETGAVKGVILVGELASGNEGWEPGCRLSFGCWWVDGSIGTGPAVIRRND